MNNGRPKPSLTQAVRFLERYITIHHLRSGDRLPSGRVLVAGSGVSYVTLSRALRELQSSGRVFVAGGRYRVGPPAEGMRHDLPAVPRAHSPKKWERLGSRISQDVLDRVYLPSSRLPSPKELSIRYGISYPTLKKSLRKLASEGILHESSTGAYFVPLHRARGWRSRIVCFCNSIDSKSIVFGLNDEAVYRALETQCEQAGLLLDLHLLFLERTKVLFRAKSTGVVCSLDELLRRGDESVLGYLYIMHLGPGEFHAPMLGPLSREKCPLVIFNESAVDPPLDPRRARRTRVFTAAHSTEPGEEVGRRLLALGHRRVAFVSPYDGLAWSRLRLEGLTRSYHAAGRAEGVVPMLSPINQSAFEEGGRIFGIGPLVDFYWRWRTRVDDPFRGGFDESFEKIRYETCESEYLRSVVHGLLDKACAIPDITAVVMANDHSAGMALEYLKAKGISCPQHLSLISFDDSPLALRKGISSYNFNAPAIAGAILGFILNKPPYRDRNARVRGFIIDRGTLGPPREYAGR